MSWCTCWAQEHVGTAQRWGRHLCVQTPACPSQPGACQEPPGLRLRGKEVTSHQRRAQPPLHPAGSPRDHHLSSSLAMLDSTTFLHPTTSPGQGDMPLAGFSSKFCAGSGPPGGHISLGMVPPLAATRAEEAGDAQVPTGLSTPRTPGTTQQMSPTTHRASGSSGFGPRQAPMGKARGARGAEGRALRAAGEAPEVHKLPASAGKAGARNTLMQPQNYFPCSPACAWAAPGKRSGGGRDGWSGGARPCPACGPNASSIVGTSSGKPECRGSRCSSGEGTQQNPRPGADIRLMQIRRVGSSIEIFPG